MVDNYFRDMLRMRMGCLCKLLNVAREKYSLRVSSLYSGGNLQQHFRDFSVNGSNKMGDELILRPLVICGPSGSGKSSLLKKLFGDYPHSFGFSVSHTTRKPRDGEKPGVDYHYTSFEEMAKDIEEGKFIEHAMFSGNRYGTSKKAVEDVQAKGQICVLDIEVQGVQQVKKTDLNPLYVFVKPPSIKALEKRLKARGTETEDSLKLRLDTATREMDYGTEDNFDLIVENEHLELAYKHLKDFLVQELKLPN